MCSRLNGSGACASRETSFAHLPDSLCPVSLAPIGRASPAFNRQVRIFLRPFSNQRFRLVAAIQHGHNNRTFNIVAINVFFLCQTVVNGECLLVPVRCNKCATHEADCRRRSGGIEAGRLFRHIGSLFRQAKGRSPVGIACQYVRRIWIEPQRFIEFGLGAFGMTVARQGKAQSRHVPRHPEDRVQQPA